MALLLMLASSSQSAGACCPSFCHSYSMLGQKTCCGLECMEAVMAGTGQPVCGRRYFLLGHWAWASACASSPACNTLLRTSGSAYLCCWQSHSQPQQSSLTKLAAHPTQSLSLLLANSRSAAAPGVKEMVAHKLERGLVCNPAGIGLLSPTYLYTLIWGNGVQDVGACMSAWWSGCSGC